MTSIFHGPIKEIVLGIYDGPHATPPESDDGPIFLGIDNLTPDGRIDLSKIRHIAERHFPEWTKRVEPRSGDIVFSYEATLHRYGIIPEGFRGCLGRRLGLIRPNPAIVDGRFLHYYFLSPKWRAVVESNIVNGATVDRIPIKNLPSFEVQIPPMQTQKYIASTLSYYDDLIENNRRRIELLEQAARLLYKEWFVHYRFPEYGNAMVKDSIPTNWHQGTLGDFFDTASGGTPSRKVPEFFEGEIAWVKTQELFDNFIFDTEEKITELAVSNSSAKVFPEGTLLVSIYGGTNIGRTGILARPAATNQACVALFPKHECANPFFAKLYFLETRSYLIGIAQGSAQTNISQQILRGMPMTLPSFKTMKAFLELVQPMFEQVKNLQLQNIRLTQARDLLLPRLMNGEIAI